MLELLRQFFLNPGMLAGAALVGVPIVIYLINRQRYQRKRWAAMEFLIRAMKRNRRRLQLQNILLLLVRCAIILLLVLAAARPVSRLGVLRLTPDQSQNWLLAIDTSYSMGFQEESRSIFDQARETIFQMMDGLMKPGDQAALMTLEEKPRILLPPTKLGDEGKRTLRREVEALSLGSGSVDLGASFAVLDELCGKFVSSLGEPQPKRIIFFSDLQRRDWLADDGPRSPGVPQYIDKIQKEGGDFAFARLTSKDSRPNLAVTDLSVSPALIAKDVWVEIRATVRCFGEEDFANVDLTLRVDQDTEDRALEPQVGQVIRVARGESVTRSLAYRFTAPGFHTVVAEVRSDGLPVDNRRYLTVKVEESVKVLLVDGEPAADPTERETFHLQVALEPEDDSMGALQGRFTPFDPRYVTPDQLGGVQWKDYAVVILAGVAEMHPDQAAALQRYVRAGGALMVFLGPNVRPEFYNQHWRGEEPFLLPAALGDVRGDKRFPVNLQISDANHPLTRYFDERKDVTHLQRPIISFERYYRVAGISPDTPGVRVAFRYTDTEKSPAVFDNACGSGRALWVTSTADTEWNEFPNWPDFVVFLYESISYLVKFGMSSSNIATGDAFRRTYPASRYAPDILLTAPAPALGHLERAQGVRKAMKSLSGPAGAPAAASESEFELVHEDTDAPGLYKLELTRPSGPEASSVEYFSANVDTGESNLRPMTPDDFRTVFQGLEYQDFDASKQIQEIQGERDLSRGKEYWRWVATCVLALLFLETVLAWLFGRRTK